MCIHHKPELLKQWRRDNQDKDSIVAYKMIEGNGKSLWHKFIWTIGKHKVVVGKLNYEGYTGSGFYVFLNRNEAFAYYIKNGEERDKVIAVHVHPKDIVYMGKDDDDCTVIVCRALEVKSLRELKITKRTIKI